MTNLHCNSCGSQMDVFFNKEQMLCIAPKGRFGVDSIFFSPDEKKVYKVKSTSPMQGWLDAEYLYLEDVPSTTD